MKLCEQCHHEPALATERYCRKCRPIVLRMMKASGYLPPDKEALHRREVRKRGKVQEQARLVEALEAMDDDVRAFENSR